MSVLDLVRVVVYRCHEKGLEVFLISPTDKSDNDLWKLPRADFDVTRMNGIELNHENDENISTIAIEGDWHDIPSIRGLVKHDLKRVKSKVKYVLPCLEKGSFVEMKQIVKKVLPNEYAALKELREIVKERNTILNI